MASDTIANRIIGTLLALIHTHQTWLIGGRYFGGNTRLIYDMMEYTKTNVLPGLLLSVNFEAFDPVSCIFYIYKVLEFFGETTVT